MALGVGAAPGWLVPGHGVNSGASLFPSPGTNPGRGSAPRVGRAQPSSIRIQQVECMVYTHVQTTGLSFPICEGRDWPGPPSCARLCTVSPAVSLPAIPPPAAELWSQPSGDSERLGPGPALPPVPASGSSPPPLPGGLAEHPGRQSPQTAQEALRGNNRRLSARGKTGGNRVEAQTVNAPQNNDKAPGADGGAESGARILPGSARLRLVISGEGHASGNKHASISNVGHTAPPVRQQPTLPPPRPHGHRAQLWPQRAA